MSQIIPPRSLTLVLSTVLVLSILFFQAFQRKGDKRVGNRQEPIRIGVFQSLTGAEASFGQDVMKGIEMAMKEINAQGGVLVKWSKKNSLRRPLEIIVRDNQSKPGETSAIARELISRYRVVALIGEVSSGRTLEAAPIAQRYRVPLLANSASNDRVTKIGNYVFRISYRDSQQGEVLARYIYLLGKRKAALLVDSSRDNSATMADSFKKQFVALGGDIVERQSYNAHDKDFQAQVTTIKNSGADCLFLPGVYTECATIMKQARSLGLNLSTFGGDSWDSPVFVNVAGKAAEGAVFTNSFSADDPDPTVQSFVRSYRSKYGKDAKPVALAVTGFDALKLMVNAIERTRVDGPDFNLKDPGKLKRFRHAIRDALAGTWNYRAVSGSITFNKNGDPAKAMVLLRVCHGRFEFIQKETPP
jgi:branched-chain amino acid transport system substrate-binding protein